MMTTKILPLNIKDSFTNFKLIKTTKTIISFKLSNKTINQTKSKSVLKLIYISSLMQCISEIFSIDSFFKSSRSFCNDIDIFVEMKAKCIIRSF